eukprot:960989-Pyramimonas_sp.AAC.1
MAPRGAVSPTGRWRRGHGEEGVPVAKPGDPGAHFPNSACKGGSRCFRALRAGPSGRCREGVWGHAD